jgi:hypothetical protein
MSPFYRTTWAILAVSLTVWLGCEAPHDNPLDPDSPKYRGPDLTGLEARARSLHVARARFSHTYSIIPELSNNGSGVVDSVWVSYRSGARIALNHIAANRWSTVISATSYDFGTYVGQPFLFTARDSVRARVLSVGPAYLFRVIEESPAVVSPDSDQVTGPHPELQWESFSASFPVTYQPTVTIDTSGMVVWTSSPLPAGVLSIIVPDSLPDGDYDWTVMVSDTFQNQSRSIEAEFTVRYPDTAY